MFAHLPAICVKLKKLHIKKSSGAKLTLNCINRKRWESNQGKKEIGGVVFCLSIQKGRNFELEGKIL